MDPSYLLIDVLITSIVCLIESSFLLSFLILSSLILYILFVNVAKVENGITASILSIFLGLGTCFAK